MEDPLSTARNEIFKSLSEALKKLGVEAEISLEAPPENMGDFAFPCFLLSKKLEKKPELIASEIAVVLKKTELVEKVEAKGPYVNFYLDPKKLTGIVLKSILERKEMYGSFKSRGIKVLLEHTSANPTGPLHVGRARNPIIGDTLARLMKKAGYDVTTEYYFDNMGKQAVLLAYGIEKCKELEVDFGGEEREHFKLVRCYQRASEAEEGDGAVKSEISGWVQRLEAGDKELFGKVENATRRMLKGIVSSLEMINIKIDSFKSESELVNSHAVSEVIELLKKTEHCHDEDGAYYLDLSGFGIHGRDTRFFLTRKDGTSLYTTRDIAYHMEKFQRAGEGGIVINVLGEDHKLPSKQLEIALSMLDSNTDMKRKPEVMFYSFVSLPEGKMSTRRGKVVYLDDLTDEILDRAYEEVKKRRPELDEMEMRRIAEAVGVGALRYNIVRIQPEKAMTFKWEEALNFEGNSAPFVQYAHARACSILRKDEERGGTKKLDVSLELSQALSLLSTDQEFELVKVLAEFPSLIKHCAEHRLVHPVAAYCHRLAETFNRFYRDCPVLQAEERLRGARLALVDASRIVLSNALDCMGIQAPESM